MRWGIAIFAVILLVGAGLAMLVEQDSGYLLIAVGNTTIEMNLWAALLALLLFWLMVRLLLRLLRSLKVFGRWRLSRDNRRRAQTAQGLLYFIEGRWGRAQRQLVRGADKSDMPLVNYLAAASAAFEQGNSAAAQTLLARAEQFTGDDDFAIDITRARLHIKAGRFEEALAILNRIHSSVPQHAYVLRLLEQTYHGLQDWDNLQKLLPQLRRQNVYDKAGFETLEVEIYAKRLSCLARRISKREDSRAQQQLIELWESLPPQVKRSPEVVSVYSDYLQGADNNEQAEGLLYKTLGTHWDDRLVRRYGLVAGGDISKRLIIAEAWLRERPNNPVLLLTLGRLAQQAELWGKARDYLENSLKLSGDPETYAELARLMAKLGETEKSTAYYQQGLMHTAASD